MMMIRYYDFKGITSVIYSWVGFSWLTGAISCCCHLAAHSSSQNLKKKKQRVHLTSPRFPKEKDLKVVATIQIKILH